jgi:acyl carrier protein
VITDNEILLRVTEVFRDVFADPTIALSLDTTADDVPDWDSMSQVTLAVEVEHRFNIKLKSAEMEELRDVRDLVDLIKRRMSVSVP